MGEGVVVAIASGFPITSVFSERRGGKGKGWIVDARGWMMDEDDGLWTLPGCKYLWVQYILLRDSRVVLSRWDYEIGRNETNLLAYIEIERREGKRVLT